jgi:hypothetical protein
MLAPTQRDLVEQLVSTLFASQKEGCQCHWIDPQKLRILLWKNTDPKQPNTYILKIAEQKFIGFVRSDKKGESYWKFRSFYDDSEPTAPATSPAEIEVNQPLKPLGDYSKEELDRRTKFLECQERAEKLASLKAEKENHASNQPTA